MGSINAVSSTDQSLASTSASMTKELGQTQFLELLVAQLQNQDPMNPMDNQQFIAQLATFSSLEQLVSINSAVTSLANGKSEGPFVDDTNSNAV